MIDKDRVQHGVINTAASGNTTLATPATGKKIKVISYVIVSGGTVNVKFRSTTTGDITGPMPLVANTGVSSGDSEYYHFKTVASEALQINLSAAVQVSGHFTYVEE